MIFEGCIILQILLVTGDLTKENEVTDIVDSGVKHFGSLDVLVISLPLMCVMCEISCV